MESNYILLNTSNNFVETKEQIEGDKNKEIKYTYGKQGNLVQVKKQSGK